VVVGAQTPRPACDEALIGKSTESWLDASKVPATRPIAPVDQPEVYLRNRFGARSAMMTLDEGGWRRPNVRVVMPPAELRSVVEFFWTDEWIEGGSPGHSFRIVADDAAHILWYLRGGAVLRTERISVAGARASHHDADLSGRCVMAGVRLVPGAIPVLFELPAFALTNRSVPLVSIIPSAGAIRVSGMRVATRGGLVDDLASLIADLWRGRAGDSRAAWIANEARAGTTTVGSFARTFGMPPRTVRAWSAKTFGMGLKRLLKIRRLHAALELRLSSAHETWGQVAAGAGYADQSHLIRDCRALLGESPSEFVARGS
jgi:AraC-like DNA-binding protein